LHVMDDKQRIALVETRTFDTTNDLTPPQTIRYQLGNHLGSATLEIDEQAQVITYEEYHPYGTTAYCAGRSKAEVSLKRYRYTGKERDEETGFSYHSARYYLPWLGRWLNCDPIGIKDHINLFCYVSNRPTKLHDPSGKSGGNAPQVSPPLGALGSVAPHGIQKNIRKLFGEIVTESEHIIPKKTLEHLLYNPLTRATEYTSSMYRNSATLVWERSAALVKTRLDNIMSKMLRGGPVNLNEVLEASVKRAISAAKKTGSIVSKEQIHRAALSQAGDLFASQRLGDTLKHLPAEKEVAKVAEKEVAKVAEKEVVKVAEKEVVKVAEKEVVKVAEKVGLQASAKLSTKVAKAIPFLGVAVGVGFVANDLRNKDYKAAAWDAAEAIPVVGTVVMAGHGLVMATNHELMTPEQELATGTAIVEKGFGANKGDVEILENFSVFGYKPFDARKNH
jgi:RHS repeat-associated protein